MFQVYFRYFLPWWYHDGFDVVLAKVGVGMISCLHLGELFIQKGLTKHLFKIPLSKAWLGLLHNMLW